MSGFAARNAVQQHGEMRRHLIVRSVELRSAHAGERVLQYFLRKGICLVKLLQMDAEARIHVVDDDGRGARKLRVGAGEGQELGGVGLQVEGKAEGVELTEALKLKSEDVQFDVGYTRLPFHQLSSRVRSDERFGQTR